MLGVISNLNLILQCPKMCISALSTLIKSTMSLNSLKKDYCFKKTLFCFSKFLEQAIKKINCLFNDTVLIYIAGCLIIKNKK